MNNIIVVIYCSLNTSDKVGKYNRLHHAMH